MIFRYQSTISPAFWSPKLRNLSFPNNICLLSIGFQMLNSQTWVSITVSHFCFMMDYLWAWSYSWCDSKWIALADHLILHDQMFCLAWTQVDKIYLLQNPRVLSSNCSFWALLWTLLSTETFKTITQNSHNVHPIGRAAGMIVSI